MGELDGQVALVTGGARGMGRSHAVALARTGADVVLMDLCGQVEQVGYPMGTEDDLAETTELVEQEGRRCLARTGDVRVFADVESVVAESLDEFGRIDILIANAGISAGAPIQTADPDQWNAVIDTNLTGVFHSFRAVAPSMIERRYGRIVGISSMVGRAAIGGAGAYVASKWGVIGLVKTAAQDLARWGITVNAVAPGNVDTPMIRNDFLIRSVRPDLAEPTFEDASKFLALLHVQPIPVLAPEDVSAAILYLVGPGGTHVTGAVIDVSAGASARFTA